MTRERIRILFPSGMLGSGLSAGGVERGIHLGADAIAIDGGSTDSGPYYLGAAIAKTARHAVADDLRILLVASQRAGIPLIVGSCGTNGTDRGVDWVAEMVEDIAHTERLAFTLGCIYSEQSATTLAEALKEDRIVELAPPKRLTADILSSCEHIVGVMGHEPIAAALAEGSNVVLAGRATDTAMVAAFAILHGLPPGPTWHAAKTVECGAQCTTDPLSGPVLVEIDRNGFNVESADPGTTCTPTSVAAHMLYENADPFQMREPSGTLITSSASYTAIDERRVRV
ncbi:MAG TPA: acyclic terpene utilization AtuA family protein, partial [Acidimicrobiales bacterium]|nr:acyclic terpene utilization AtuA family protein [Acidimicrobiales bacterium]